MFGGNSDTLNDRVNWPCDVAACPNCGHRHKVKWGKHLGFVTCPENGMSYLAETVRKSSNQITEENSC